MAETTLPPLVTIASQPGAGGELVAPRVAEALGTPFLDRALPADPEEPNQRAGGVVSSLARASTMLASPPVERLDLDEGHVRAELGEFLARAESTGGVVLGRGSMIVLADAPGALHVLLTGPREGRIARVAARDGVGRDEAERRVRARDRARREYVRRTFGVEADDRALYHLVIDTVALGLDAAVELVVTAGRARARRRPATEMLELYRTVGIFPSRRHLNAALDKIEAVRPATLACHHGSVKGGRAVHAYLRTLREHDVTGLTEWNPMAEPTS